MEDPRTQFHVLTAKKGESEQAGPGEDSSGEKKPPPFPKIQEKGRTFFGTTTRGGGKKREKGSFNHVFFTPGGEKKKEFPQNAKRKEIITIRNSVPLGAGFPGGRGKAGREKNPKPGRVKKKKKERLKLFPPGHQDLSHALELTKKKGKKRGFFENPRQEKGQEETQQNKKRKRRKTNARIKRVRYPHAPVG